jgi:hypothetical protein
MQAAGSPPVDCSYHCWTNGSMCRCLEPSKWLLLAFIAGENGTVCRLCSVVMLQWKWYWQATPCDTGTVLNAVCVTLVE